MIDSDGKPIDAVRTRDRVRWNENKSAGGSASGGK